MGGLGVAAASVIGVAVADTGLAVASNRGSAIGRRRIAPSRADAPRQNHKKREDCEPVHEPPLVLNPVHSGLGLIGIDDDGAAVLALGFRIAIDEFDYGHRSGVAVAHASL